MELQNEYYYLQNIYGTERIRTTVGDYKSYIYLRDTHTYQTINDLVYNITRFYKDNNTVKEKLTSDKIKGYKKDCNNM